MQHLSWVRRVLTGGVALAATIGLLPLASATSSAAAAAAPPSYAADLPNLSTPQVAYDRDATQPAKGVAARGADGALLYSARSGTGFAPFQSLGGSIVGDPSAVVTPNGTELFVRGTNDVVYTNTVSSSGAVTGYSAVPGLSVTGEVESIVPRDEPTGSVRLFARGTDGAVWTNVRRSGSWVGWSSLGGSATSDITASRLISTIGGNVRIFVRGSDHRVYLNQVSPTGASGFQPVDGLRVTSNIAIAEDRAINGLQIFARGEDNRVYRRTLALSNATWEPLNGVSATSDIAVNFEVLYVRGSDNAIYVSPSQNKDGAFQRIEGQVTGNPAAFNNQPNGGSTQYLLARQPNGALGFNIRPNNGYTPISGPAID
ncbi:hypothetical protein [Actinomadura macra]|uniref:hypothetical protein n=1 Tax=Actinomadura macra TaxID=46164 RepID=UPI0008302B46|nr:hypothetical protein [Actinomadura macra]